MKGLTANPAKFISPKRKNYMKIHHIELDILSENFAKCLPHVRPASDRPAADQS